MPPLGLLTLAGMFPENWRLRVVDMSARPLLDADLQWADAVFVSAMIVQKRSLAEVARRANRANVPVIAGGPYPTSYHDVIEGVDHFVLGDAEEVFPRFLSDFEEGRAKKMYRAEGFPSMSKTPLPRYDLVRPQDYSSMQVQFSRGCPFPCKFCDIPGLYGKIPRTKSNQQIIAELNLLLSLGWRRLVFFVDDNFIGNKKEVMRLLPTVSQWQKEHKHPFRFYTEASVNLAKEEKLMDLMVRASFTMVFLGIETPNPEALKAAKKVQNVKNGDSNYLLEAVRTIQRKGMEVSAGFILGMDGEKEDAFDAQIEFPQIAGIPMAMTGLLTVLRAAPLHDEMKKTGRLIEESTGNNMDIALNFAPEMNRQTLIEGYKRVRAALYDPGLKNYFARCLTLFENWKARPHAARQIGRDETRALLFSLLLQIFSRQGPAYLAFLAKVITHRPAMFPEAIRLAIQGYHFEKITNQQIVVERFKLQLEKELDALRERVTGLAHNGSYSLGEVGSHIQARVKRIRSRYRRIHRDFRHAARDAADAFTDAVKKDIVSLFGRLPPNLELAITKDS